MPEGERLQKVLARAGYGSRRACEELIAAGRVRVDGVVAELGGRVAPTQRLEVDGVAVGHAPGLVHYLLNKPRGVVCSADDEHGRPGAVTLVPAEPRVFTVGRLDMDSEGLLIVTNDGDLAQLLTHPSHGAEKEYLVEVRRPGAAAPPEDGVPRSTLASLRRGVELEDGMTLPARASQPSPGTVRIVIHEGRNRQIRRMFEHLGWEVARLVRVRIGPLVDPTLGPGQWRELAPSELIALRRAAEPSANRGR